MHRTLGNLETGLQHLTNEVLRSNQLLTLRHETVEKRLSALERLRDRVGGGVAVVSCIIGTIWAVLKVIG